jgi:hypothetical protein
VTEHRGERDFVGFARNLQRMPGALVTAISAARESANVESRSKFRPFFLYVSRFALQTWYW